MTTNEARAGKPRTEAGRRAINVLTEAIRYNVLATEGEAAAAPALDVERLAEAMNIVRPYGGNPSEWAKVAARQIAAEYARLSGKAS